MKYINLIVFLSLLSLSEIISGNPILNTKVENNNDSILALRIENYCSDKDLNINTLKQVVTKTSAVSTESGVIKTYYDDSNMLIIVDITYYGEWGKTITKYYFELNNLVQVRFCNIKYDKPIYIEGYTTQTEDEIKYYFDNYQLIGVQTGEGIIIGIQEHDLLNKGNNLIQRLLLFQFEMISRNSIKGNINN